MQFFRFLVTLCLVASPTFAQVLPPDLESQVKAGNLSSEEAIMFAKKRKGNTYNEGEKSKITQPQKSYENVQNSIQKQLNVKNYREALEIIDQTIIEQPKNAKEYKAYRNRIVEFIKKQPIDTETLAKDQRLVGTWFFTFPSSSAPMPGILNTGTSESLYSMTANFKTEKFKFKIVDKDGLKSLGIDPQSTTEKIYRGEQYTLVRKSKGDKNILTIRYEFGVTSDNEIIGCAIQSFKSGLSYFMSDCISFTGKKIN